MFKESTSPEKGRILLATQDLEPNTIIIQDEATLGLPDGYPVCLGCLEPVSAASVPCSHCSWLLCSHNCPHKQNHDLECKVFSKNNFSIKISDYSKRHMMYSIIPVLKIVLLKENNYEKSAVIEALMDHWQDLQKDPQTIMLVKYMAALFRKQLNLSWVTDEDVQHAFGVLKTNGLGRGGRSCFVYPTVCLLSHSCSANLDLVGSPDFQVKFRAKRKILEGEELTWSYANILDFKQEIRIELRRVWNFDCTCERCFDSTEFGTHFSTQQCDCGGYFFQDSCEKCLKTHGKISYSEQRELLQQIYRASLETLHKLEGKVFSNYHPSHLITSRFTIRLLDLLMETPEKISINKDKIKKMGEDLLKTLDKIDGRYGRPYLKYQQILKIILS